MNCKLMALEVFAIFTSYLVFSIAFVSATNVKIYYNGIYQSPSVNYNPQSFISKDISIDPVSLNVRINIKNASSVQLGKIYVYKCRGLSPGLCVSGIQPEIAEGSFDSTYSWAALSDRTSGYPQNANILVFASVDGSVPFWTGFFYRIERTSSGNFVPYEYNADEIEVHAKDLSDVSLIRSFISSSKSIPINPNWVAKIVFPVAEGLYIIKTTFSGIQSYQFSASEISQNQISGMDIDYGFVFANASGSIFNPVTIYLNPDYICGNSNCETEKGETQANCCLDCSCQAGYYCDTTAGCKQISGITLSLYGTQQTKVSNCYQQHTINITVRINNPPTGMSVTSTVYKLGTNPFIQTQCSGGQQTGYIFSCPVIVPAVPNCNEGTYRVGPNFINFSITYPDGKSQKTKVLSVQFPDITIGSFSCGNLLCEESLGETQSNCCYDCGCPSGYCNADQINPIKGSCETDPTNANLNVVGLFPSNFYTHRSGDSVSFLAQISNAPVTISKFYPSCSISCSRNDGQPCSSSCSVSCSKSESSDNSVYNSSCSMVFSISDYDALKSYNLFPKINVSISYKNGSIQGEINKVLSASAPTISIGSHWCGDKKCDPDETSSNCCFDCPCQNGYYCDTKNVEYPSEGDSCKSKEGISVYIDNIGPVAFTDSYEEHIINVTGRVTGRPGGLNLTPSCVFNSLLSGVPCYVSCQENAGSDSAGSDSSTYRFVCEVVVPPINYNTSKFYNPATRKIILSPNSINMTLSYYNGPSVEMKEYSFSVPDVVINVVPKCGNEMCEIGVGESGANCCVDCGCLKEYGNGYFCYTGRVLNGECLSVSEINMAIQRIEPDPANCTIMEKGGKCIFARSLKIYPTILNPPSDLEVTESFYRINNSGNYTLINCYRLPDGEGNYSCSIVLESIPNASPGKETRTIDLKMSLAYTLNGALVVANVSDQKSFNVNRQYSEALASCIQQQQSIERKLKDLESDKTLYTVLAVIFFIISLVFWILYLTSCFSQGCNDLWKTIAIIAAIVGGCGLAFVLNRLSSIDGKIQSLQAQKQGICAASTFGELSGSTSSASTWIYTIGELYGGITCMMGVTGAVGGLSWGGTTSTGGNVGGGVSQPSWMSDYATPGNAWRFNTPVTTDI